MGVLQGKIAVITGGNSERFASEGAFVFITGRRQGELDKAATKAALRSYARTWTAGFGKRGIRANVISPGPIEEPILDRQFTTKEAADALRAQFKATIPLGRIGLPDEVAAALFLARVEDGERKANARQTLHLVG